MIPGKTYYQWKVRSSDGELYTPWSDPWKYEFPFDFLFDSIEQAVQGLEDWGALDEAHQDEWVLVTMGINVVEHVRPPNPLEDEYA